MAIASASSPAWLHTLAQIASVILVVELLVVLVIVCALMFGLAFGMHWLREHVLPIVRENAPRAQQALSLTQQNTDRIVRGVAEFYGRREAARTSLRVLLFGRQGAAQVHEDSQVQAAADLHLISGEQASFSLENGLSSQLAAAREDSGYASGQARPASLTRRAGDGRGDRWSARDGGPDAPTGNAG